MAQGTKDALKGIQNAIGQGATPGPDSVAGVQAPPGAVVVPGYNMTRVKRVKVAVPLETCAVAQQTPSKRDVQVGLSLLALSSGNMSVIDGYLMSRMLSAFGPDWPLEGSESFI